MRDLLDLDLQSFTDSIDQMMRSDIVTSISAEVLSRISPNELNSFQNDFFLSSRSKEDVVLLAVYSWYCPEEIGILLRMNLKRLSRSQNYYFLEFLLENKGEMLCFLEETSLWHSRDFFGNILNWKRIKRLKYLFGPVMARTRRPKRIQRHRGYRDKGTLRIQSDIHDLSSGTRMQNRLEDERLEILHTTDFIRGWIFGG